MKQTLLGMAALGVVVATGSAFAADIAAPIYKAPVMAPTAYSWTGCYVGIEGGGAWGSSRHVGAGLPAPAALGVPITNSFDLSGGLLGGTVGCNYQVGSWVFGIEDDFSWTNKKGGASDIPPFNTVARSETNEKWLDTLRGRLGFAWDRALIYGTGGAAFADTGVKICNPAVGFCVSDSQTRTGWVAGAGIEYAVWDNLSVKIEYLHADFGTGRYVDPPVTGPGGGTVVTRNVSLSDDIVRVGLNWRFNWAPVVAKY
jgi:outer membrane immunogenic protein